jgi:hypothetical protein
MNKYKGILDYNAQSKTMTPRTDAVCDEFAPSCKNPPFHYIANHARELEKECVYLKKSLEALYKELHSEQERRVIAQEGCMKLDAIMSAIVAAMPNAGADAPATKTLSITQTFPNKKKATTRVASGDLFGIGQTSPPCQNPKRTASKLKWKTATGG